MGELETTCKHLAATDQYEKYGDALGMGRGKWGGEVPDSSEMITCSLGYQDRAGVGDNYQANIEVIQRELRL